MNACENVDGLESVASDSPQPNPTLAVRYKIPSCLICFSPEFLMRNRGFLIKP